MTIIDHADIAAADTSHSVTQGNITAADISVTAAKNKFHPPKILPFLTLQVRIAVILHIFLLIAG
jgi:hypothetical protein